MKLDLLPQHVYKLQTLGACSMPALFDEHIKSLLEEAHKLPFKKLEPLTKTRVIQDFSGIDTFPPGSRFMELAKGTALMLNRSLLRHRVLCQNIIFNDFSLQRYPASAPGQEFALSPHLDYSSCINVIALYLLEGESSFFICKDKNRLDPVEIKAVPGDLIMMRGAGFDGNLPRPYHFVGSLSKQRTTFGLRQVMGKPFVRDYLNAPSGP